MSNVDNMIEVRTLTKRFDGFTALNKMELHVPKGSIYGLVGPNGAGKTTLIRHIAGVYYPEGGNVLVDNRPVWENPEIKARMIHIPDDLNFIPSANINDLVGFYRHLYPRFNIDRFEKLKAAFPLDLKRRVSKFSKGMQKQAALWLALCCMPDVMLLDEPVDGLDPVARRIVWSLILRDVAERQTTILVSSHNLRELDGISDHIGIMRDGILLLERAIADLQGDVTKLQIVFAKKGAGAPPFLGGGVDGSGGGDLGYNHPGAVAPPLLGGELGAVAPPLMGGELGAGAPSFSGGGADSAGAPVGEGFFIPGFEILHVTRNGQLFEYIVRGGVDAVLAAVRKLEPQPLLADAVPLTLEEIFIYELGGMDYAELI